MTGEHLKQASTLILVSLSHAINHSFWVLIPTLTPLILEELNLTYVGAGTIFSVYLAAYAAGQIPLGFLAHKVSRPIIMGSGLIISSIGTALTAIAPDYYAILAFQALAGFGGAAHHPLALYLISDVFPQHRLGRALSLHGVSSSISFAITPMAAVAMLGLGWRFPLLAFSALAAVAGILIIAFIRVKPEKVRETPVFSRLLRSPDFGKLLATYGLFSLGQRGIVNFLPLMLAALYQVTVSEAGWWFSIFFFLGLAGQPLVGYLSDRFGWRKIIFSFLAASSAAVMGFALQIPFWFLVAATGLFMMPMVILHELSAIEFMPEEVRGIGFGILFTVGVALASVSTTLTGFLVDSLWFPATYAILATIFLLEIPIFLSLSRKHGRLRL
mgnify:CR=1 FL=1